MNFIKTLDNNVNEDIIELMKSNENEGIIKNNGGNGK